MGFCFVAMQDWSGYVDPMSVPAGDVLDENGVQCHPVSEKDVVAFTNGLGALDRAIQREQRGSHSNGKVTEASVSEANEASPGKAACVDARELPPMVDVMPHLELPQQPPLVDAMPQLDLFRPPSNLPDQPPPVADAMPDSDLSGNPAVSSSVFPIGGLVLVFGVHCLLLLFSGDRIWLDEGLAMVSL